MPDLHGSCKCLFAGKGVLLVRQQKLKLCALFSKRLEVAVTKTFYAETGMGKNTPPGDVKLVRENIAHKSIVLVGLMGAGKTTIGRRVAQKLNLDFVDADHEIERAADMSVAEIFEKHGEKAFRDGERRVIARLLENGPQVLATGGGAYMDEQTRKAIGQNGICIWLDCKHSLLMKRVRRRSTRPLLQTADPDQTMRDLMDERYPVYAKADIRVESRDVPHNAIVNDVIAALAGFLDPNSTKAEQ